MKHFLLTALLLSSLLVTSSLAQQSPTGFTVHEWGTFTTLTGSDGILLPGLYHEEEALPSFVDNFPGFSNGGRIRKGLYLECDNVTLKMETPVIYFYSDIARSVTVRVDWPGGTISQWYPNRTDGETLTPDASGRLDFGTAHNGWIQWKANILAKSENDTVGMWKPYETPIWEAPRATDANMISGPSGEIEKYLFYRGVGNAAFMDGGKDQHYLLKTSFQGNSLVIQNLTHYNILYGFVFERAVDPATGDSTNRVWWSGPINDAQKIKCSAPATQAAATFDAALITLRDKLVEKGLFKKEADAMINTWKQSYFGTPGLRVFWIVPKSATDKSLPISITPKPDNIERILVARSEILTPQFEKKLADDFANGNGYNYYNDRYYLAYQARVAAMLSAGVSSENLPALKFRLYPNPSRGNISFSSGESGTAEISIINLLGSEVAHIFSGQIETGNHSFTYDASKMENGTYICVIRINGHTEKYPIILVK